MTGPWLPRALLLVSSGYCPNDQDTPLDTNGWCPTCRIRYSLTRDGDTVVAEYPPDFHDKG